MEINIIGGSLAHVPEIRSIVNHNILTASSIYDYGEKTAEEMEQWFTDKQNAGWPILIAEAEGKVAGYATYGTFRAKEGYKYTVEHSVYVHHEYQGKGIGGMLLEALIALCREQGYHTMIGCIDAANTGSIAFHKRYGFTEAGLLKQSAFKFGQWLDLLFMQLMLQPVGVVRG
ncbi:N-acetyltransferase [Flavobacterium cyanobacteriorum]|uniref:N-acetyltransferase n=1 Tax=Flavobacterium cyanobacteriorum TaxID=2022802 RepID=A0A256A0U5_9FLAO|nr:GNAT family N-acetyltransferase [Flavobacterium cyanobacteriorum]OYQ47417.1 N-acetyltransferase [Flavobacterium cyanobacteriorum]